MLTLNLYYNLIGFLWSYATHFISNYWIWHEIIVVVLHFFWLLTTRSGRYGNLNRLHFFYFSKSKNIFWCRSLSMFTFCLQDRYFGDELFTCAVLATTEAEGQMRRLADVGQRKQALRLLPAPLWASGCVWWSPVFGMRNLTPGETLMLLQWGSAT